MAPIDYRWRLIQVRIRSNGEFAGDVVGSCHVLGAVVEASLRLAYRPEVGSLPHPLAMQSAVLFPVVMLRDVLLAGEMHARKSLEVKVYPEDAYLTLAVARSGLLKLQCCLNYLEVLSVDHTGSS